MSPSAGCLRMTTHRMAESPAASSKAKSDPMTSDQAAELRRLANLAYDLDAFDAQLTQSEAERRIATLKAKLPLQGEPPHTA